MSVLFYPYHPRQTPPSEEVQKGADILTAAQRQLFYMQFCAKPCQTALKDIAKRFRVLSDLTEKMEGAPEDLKLFKEQIDSFHPQEESLYFFTRWVIKLLDFLRGILFTKRYGEFELINVPGDGNCGFHALAVALFPTIDAAGRDQLQALLRKQVVEHIKESPKDFSHGGIYYIKKQEIAEKDAYLEYIQKQGNFADEIVMNALSDLLRRPITLHTEYGPQEFGKDFAEEAATLQLLLQREHFQALIKRAGQSAG